MTLCNLSIEAGGRLGLVAPDETTFAWLRGRPFAPAGRGFRARGRGLAAARQRRRRDVRPRGRRSTPREIAPTVTWGTSPEQAAADRRDACRTPTASPTRRARRRCATRSPTWACAPGMKLSRHAASTACSSARAPTAASRICARPRRCCAGARPRFPGSCRRAPSRSSGRRRRRGSTASSATPGWNGSSPAAPCAWA